MSRPSPDTHTVPVGRLLAELAATADELGTDPPDLHAVHRLSRNGLIAHPRQVGQLGNGSVSFYRPADVGIAQDAMRSHACGVRRWRDKRLLAWLHGHDPAQADMVEDAASFASETVARINHELRTAQWSVPMRGEIPNRPRYRRLAADLVSELHPDSLRPRLNGASPETLRVWEPILSAPSLQATISALMHLALEDDPEGVVAHLKTVLDTITTSLIPDPEEWEPDVRALAGYLNQADDVIATAVRDAGATRLEAARFVMRFGGAFAQKMASMAVASLRAEERPDPKHRAETNVLIGLIDGVLRIGHPRHDAERLALLLTIVMFERHHPTFDVVGLAAAMCEFGEEADHAEALLAAGTSPEALLRLLSEAGSEEPNGLDHGSRTVTT